MSIQDYKAAVYTSIEKAIRHETKLPPAVLNMEGMSSHKNRVFLNTLVEILSPRYLEIGVWKGSTFVSALYGNHPDYAVAIDNFCQYAAPGQPGYLPEHGNPREDFVNNVKLIATPYEFYDSASFSINKTLFKKPFNVYFYDGGHEAVEQMMALTYFKECLENEFVFICDDWNWDAVRFGTAAGFKEAKIQVHQAWELSAYNNGDKENWWNGFFVGICSK